MREMGDWDVQGIEPSSHAVLRARQRYGLDVRVGQLDELHFPANAFDVVTMWHVLEHLPQPRAVLQEVARILRPDGVLVLVCPIADSWEAEHFGPFWSGYDVPRHLYTFSRETLGKLLLECGMHCQEISGVIEGFNSLRISTTFWLNEKMPQKIQNESLVALTVNFAAGLLYLLVKLDKARGSGVAAFYATMSAPS
jgi:SAM-dependent methyltransferase